MKYLNTFATVVAIFTIILVMLAAMAFQISSEQIARESTAAQAPAGQLGLGESALASGDYPAAIQYADRVLISLGNTTSPTQDLLRYNALLLKGQAQLANGDVLAARKTLALACAYKSTWAPAYYYRGVAHFVRGKSVEAQQDFEQALANGLDVSLRNQA